MSNLLITGGTGMIASYCARRALEQGHRVSLLDAEVDREQIRDIAPQVSRVFAADILDQEGLRAAFGAERFDAVVHTAGMLAMGFERDPAMAIRVNVEGSAQVMHAALESGIPRVVLFSSMMIYAQTDLDAFERVSEERGVDPDTLYGASKYAAEIIGRTLARSRGLGFVALRLPRVFGLGYRRPDATPNPGTNWMLQMVDRALAGKGGPAMPALGVPDEWVYAADVADATVRAATLAGLTPGAYNVGSGVLWTPRDLVEAFADVSGVPFEYLEPPLPSEAVRAWRMKKPSDLSASERHLGYRPRFSDPRSAVRELLAFASC